MKKPSVLFQDEEILVVSKEKREHFDEILPKDSPWKPVHRLDYETSGCLLFTKADCFQAYRGLFSTENPQTLVKHYLAGCGKGGPSFATATLVHGWIVSRHRSSKKVRFLSAQEEGLARSFRTKQLASHWVEGSLAEADSRTKVARRLGFQGEIYSVQLVTGCRHQIRAYFADQISPLLGDPIYGTEAERLELHAWKLQFTSPITTKNYTIVDEEA